MKKNDINESLGYVADDDEDDGYKSRSQKKRESTALQELGEELSTMPAAKVRALGVPEDIVQAVIDYQAMPTYESKRRQLQYLGRIMREVGDLGGLQERMQSLRGTKREEAEAFQHLEFLREQLLDSDAAKAAEALNTVFERYPAADRQQLRQIVRNARKEREAQKPPKQFRVLFRFLRELDEQA